MRLLALSNLIIELLFILIKYIVMKIIRYFLIALPIFFACGCGEIPENTRFAPIKNYSPENSIEIITLEECELEPIESSYTGKLFIKNGSIGFVDERFCWVFMFDENGMFQKRYLGQGEGPQEIATGMIDGYACLNNGSFFFMGSGTDCHIFDEQFQRTNMFIIKPLNDYSLTDYERPWTYTPWYSNLIMKNHGKYLYFNVYSEYEHYNAKDSPNSYFKNVHIIDKLNLETGVEEQVLGYYPDIYTEDKSLRQLENVYFDVDSKGMFYIVYEGDSLIYTFDQTYYPVSTFGYQGKKMIKKTLVLDGSSPTYWQDFMQNRKERGMYNGIIYVEETGLLFRTYLKGSETGSGLQIYKKSVLLGDVDVPNGFKMLGYIKPYYYASCGIDEDNEKIVLYKFKL